VCCECRRPTQARRTRVLTVWVGNAEGVVVTLSKGRCVCLLVDGLSPSEARRLAVSAFSHTFTRAHARTHASAPSRTSPLTHMHADTHGRARAHARSHLPCTCRCPCRLSSRLPLLPPRLPLATYGAVPLRCHARLPVRTGYSAEARPCSAEIAALPLVLSSTR
jgi:hypothetical protein